MTTTGRALLTGWSSFFHGEATAGDLLSLRTVERWLRDQGYDVDTALSRGLTDEGVDLEQVDPTAYSLLVFACGPCHGWQVEQLHERFPRAHRVAVGVSVIDPTSAAVTGFHRVLARDGAGLPPTVDLAAGSMPSRQVPVAGVLLANSQPEYAGQQRHSGVHTAVTQWLSRLEVATLELDTRVSRDEWNRGRSPEQVVAQLGRADVVVTSRLHGLVLGLGQGIPVLAVEPVAGGAKVSAQARAWDWPAILGADELTPQRLDHWWHWCLSGPGRQRAQAARAAAVGGLQQVHHQFTAALD